MPEEKYKLYLGDCLDILPTLEAGSVDAVITSPPYNVGKSYEQDTDTSEYVALLQNFIQQSARVLDCGGWLVINTADVACGTEVRKNVNPVLPMIDAAAILNGFTLYDRRIWHKDPAWMNSRWHSSSVKSVEEFEYIFIYQKEGNSSRLYDFTSFMRAQRDNIKMTNSQIDDAFGFNGMAGHWTSSGSQPATPTPEQWEKLKSVIGIKSNTHIDGIVDRFSQKIRDRLSNDEWTNWGSRGVWRIGSVRKNDDHPAKFPLELPKRVTRLLTLSGDTVLDPFMGSGTTGVACMQTGRNFIGIELDPDYYAIAEKRISEAAQQMRMFNG